MKKLLLSLIGVAALAAIAFAAHSESKTPAQSCPADEACPMAQTCGDSCPPAAKGCCTKAP